MGGGRSNNPIYAGLLLASLNNLSEHSSLTSYLSKMTAWTLLIRVECIVALLLAEDALTVLGCFLERVFVVPSIELGESNGERE